MSKTKRTKIDHDELRDAAMLILSCGARIIIPDGQLGCDVSPDDLILWLTDTEVDKPTFFAKMEGVSVELYRAFRAFQQSHGECTGTTQWGAKCRSSNTPGHDLCWDEIHRFQPGVSDRCRFHPA
jgi:hypothetical protein